jgi:hypothetical protein
MEKIKTIFDRDWEGNRGCINKMIVSLEELSDCVATEKIDGTNIRLTFRCSEIVRVEKRRNPNKLQKKKGIKEPWYIDANREDPQDKWIFNAIDNTNLTHIPDGEFSAEAFGKNIQGNPLKLDYNTVFVFGYKPELNSIQFQGVPLEYTLLKDQLPTMKSFFNPLCNIEGIVWHGKEKMFKIKTKDFK